MRMVRQAEVRGRITPYERARTIVAGWLDICRQHTPSGTDTLTELIVDAIESEKSRSSMDPWGTHFPVLAACVARTRGPVLELGCGWYSTPMLHLLCSGMRRLVSADSDRDWIGRFMDFQDENHKIRLVEDWDRFDELGQEIWDVALVDHAPAERRIIDILRLRRRARFIVVHDTETPGYRYEEVLPSFRHRFDYKKLVPWTTVVSDFDPFAS